jgi:beta-lactamase regulating signal transducer with metallopeptidase domain
MKMLLIVWLIGCCISVFGLYQYKEILRLEDKNNKRKEIK